MLFGLRAEVVPMQVEGPALEPEFRSAVVCGRWVIENLPKGLAK